MSLVEFKCHSCGKESEIPPDIGRRDDCESCGADIHCCLNCKFYDVNSYNECKEVQADVVKEKDRSNFCDYFLLGAGGSQGLNKKEDLLAAAESLFKK